VLPALAVAFANGANDLYKPYC